MKNFKIKCLNKDPLKENNDLLYTLHQYLHVIQSIFQPITEGQIERQLLVYD